MDQPPLQQGLVSRKEPEFIDHDLPLQSLLAPTYMRDPSNYIIDFMDSTPLLFPNKSLGHVPGNNSGNSHQTAATTVSNSIGAGYGGKVTDTVSLTPDLHFPSSIFHYRPTPNDVAVSNVASVAEAALNVLNTPTQSTAPLPLVMGAGRGSSSTSGGVNYGGHNKHTHTHSHTHPTDYITLNGDFLSGGAGGGGVGVGGNKSYCDDGEAVNQASEDVAVQQFLLGNTNVSLDDAAADLMDASDDVLYARHISNARKVLPHKKRISRKLRVSLSSSDNMLPPPLSDVHKMPMPMPEEERLNVPVYSCEICGSTSDSQLQFFAHLKQHYEPSTPDTILAAMKTSLEELEPQKMCVGDKKSSNDNVDQVFNDVHLNFPDFTGVDETPMRHVMDAGDDVNNEMNASDINKCMSYVTRNPSPPLKRTVEVEFSDSEDMLEGIRNVVDKVSIEDTCDALDLITSNGMRGSWFSNDNYGTIAYKNKPFNDVPFTEPLPPMPMMSSTSLSRRTHSRVQTPLPPAEKLLSYQKADNRRDKLDMELPSAVNIDDGDEVRGRTNRSTFYSDTLPPIRLPSTEGIDADDNQLRCRSPQDITTPADLLQPLRVAQFELHGNHGAQIPLENGHLTDINMQQQVEGELDGSVVVEEEVFCKEEPNAQEYEAGNKVVFDVRDVDDRADEDDADEDNCEPDAGNEDDADASYEPSSTTVSDNGKEKKHFCAKCKREFNSLNALKYHLRTHTGLRPHKCDTCGKCFFALNALKAHKRTHTGDKPFKCEFCQRDFRQWGDLKYHVVSKHTEDKSHQCEFCGKAFSRKYSLVLHRRIHTSERNFKCDYCDRTFRASIYLQDHRKIHTGEKPHECLVCSKRFRLHGDLRRHERIHQRNSDGKKSSKSNAPI